MHARLLQRPELLNSSQLRYTTKAGVNVSSPWVETAPLNRAELCFLLAEAKAFLVNISENVNLMKAQTHSSATSCVGRSHSSDTEFSSRLPSENCRSPSSDTACQRSVIPREAAGWTSSSPNRRSTHASSLKGDVRSLLGTKNQPASPCRDTEVRMPTWYSSVRPCSSSGASLSSFLEDNRHSL